MYLSPWSDVTEQNAFVTDLENFIGRLLLMVEVDLTIDLTKQGKIRDQVHGELD